MKVKHVDEIVVKMSPWERDALIGEIRNVIAAYDRTGQSIYPLALHDFKEELEKAEAS
jgi:hypothetical protein